jgi:palmitoyltransferase ZDHHC9/14/18
VIIVTTTLFFQVFFLRGRFIFGPDVKSIFTTLFLVIAPVAVFCAFVARKLLDDFPHHSGYSILIVVIVHTIFVSYNNSPFTYYYSIN